MLTEELALGIATPATADAISAMWTEPEQAESGFKYEVHNDVAFILLTNEAGDSAVWRVPADKLDWAKSMFPVYIERLPALVAPEVEKLRRLRLRLKRQKLFYNADDRARLIKQIADLEAEVEKIKQCPPIPRYRIVKTVEGRPQLVHRLFLDARIYQNVEAIDGDYLNFCKTKITRRQWVVEGYDYFRDSKDEISWVSNLQVASCSFKSQETFDASHLSFSESHQNVGNDIDGTLVNNPLPVLVNADLGRRVGIEGGLVADAGRFRSFSHEDKADGLSGVGSFGSQDAAVKALQRRWRIPFIPSHQRRF